MNKYVMTMAILIAVAGSASAQSNAVSLASGGPARHVPPAHVQFLQTEQGQKLRDAMRAGNEEYRQAQANLPAVKQLDAQIADLEKQLKDLRQRRLDTIENDTTLAAKKADMESTRKALYDEIQKHMPPVPARFAKKNATAPAGNGNANSGSTR